MDMDEDEDERVSVGNGKQSTDDANRLLPGKGTEQVHAPALAPVAPVLGCGTPRDGASRKEQRSGTEVGQTRPGGGKEGRIAPAISAEWLETEHEAEH